MQCTIMSTGNDGGILNRVALGWVFYGYIENMFKGYQH